MARFGDLRIDGHALVAQLGGAVEDQPPPVELGVGLHDREGEARARVRREPSEELELGVRGLAHLAVHAARHDLEHAVPRSRSTLASARQLLLVGEGARDLVAPARVVGEDARRRDAERAGVHPGARDVRPSPRGRRGSPTPVPARSPITYARTAACGTCVPTSIMRGRSASASRYSGNDSHRQSMPSHSAVPGMSSTPSMSSTSACSPPGCTGAKPTPQLPDHDGGHAVPARRPELRVPRGLAVVVRVHVDEARGDQQAVGVDGLARRAVDPPELGDPPVTHRDVAGERLPSESVDDGAAADHEVMHGGPPCFGVAETAICRGFATPKAV